MEENGFPCEDGVPSGAEMIVLGVVWLNCESLLKSMGRTLFRWCGMDVEGGFIGKVCPVRAALRPCPFCMSASCVLDLRKSCSCGLGVKFSCWPELSFAMLLIKACCRSLIVATQASGQKLPRMERLSRILTHRSASLEGISGMLKKFTVCSP